MILKSKYISKFVQDIKDKQIVMETIIIKYNPSHDYVKIDGYGVSGIEQDEEYYLNIEDNLEAAVTSWLDPICKEGRTTLEAEINVHPDGNFKSDEIQAIATINVPSDVESYTAFLYRRLQPFVFLYSNVTEYRLRGFEVNINQVDIKFDINPALINKAYREKNLNKTILEQWLYITEKSVRDCRNQLHTFQSFKVVNGKIMYKYKTERITTHVRIQSEGLAK